MGLFSSIGNIVKQIPNIGSGGKIGAIKNLKEGDYKGAATSIGTQGWYDAYKGIANPQDPNDPMSKYDFSAPTRAFGAGQQIGEEKAAELYGPKEQYQKALQDIMDRQKQYFEKGADFSQRLAQQREQAGAGRQLRSAQAGAGLRGGLASAQRTSQVQQDALSREALDESVKRQALQEYDQMVGRRTASIQQLPLAYGALLGSMESSKLQTQIAATPQSQSQGLLGGLFSGLGGIF